MLASPSPSKEVLNDPTHRELSSLKRKHTQHQQAKDDDFKKKAKTVSYTDEHDKICEFLHKAGTPLNDARRTLIGILTSEAQTATTGVEKDAYELVANKLMLNTPLANNYVARVTASVLAQLHTLQMMEHVPGWNSTHATAKDTKPTKPKEKKDKK